MTIADNVTGGGDADDEGDLGHKSRSSALSQSTGSRTLCPVATMPDFWRTLRGGAPKA